MDLSQAKSILPAFPRTLHLNTNDMSSDDILATSVDIQLISNASLNTFVEEKIDGANCGMALVDGYPIIRNRDHILRKGYVKNTKAKKQFASIWTWFYDHMHCFERLKTIAGDRVSVYGEWMYAMHTVYYDQLPDIFIAFDLYDYKHNEFMESNMARYYLYQAGFSLPPLLESNMDGVKIDLDKLINKKSEYSSKDLHEGLYVKVCDEERIVKRFKLIRPGLTRPDNWLNTPLVRNRRLELSEGKSQKN